MEENTNPIPEETNLPANDTVAEEQVAAEPVTNVITAEQVEAYRQRLRSEQNLPFGILACLGAALVGAAAWALVTVTTKYQIGYMAVGVGFLVGFANRYFGKGIDKSFGFLGAAFAFLGCLLGNFLSIAYLAGGELGVSGIQVIQTLGVGNIFSIYFDNISPIDFLFYGLALYEGYRFSFRVITEEELASAAAA